MVSTLTCWGCSRQLFLSPKPDSLTSLSSVKSNMRQEQAPQILPDVSHFNRLPGARTCHWSRNHPHIKWQQLLKTAQHELLSGWSCPTNHLSVVNKAPEAKDKSLDIDRCFFDFRQAFYMVTHWILSTKLLALEVFGSPGYLDKEPLRCRYIICVHWQCIIQRSSSS